MGRLRRIDPLFQGIGKNIAFRPSFLNVPEKNIDFRPPFSDISGKQPVLDPYFCPNIDFKPPFLALIDFSQRVPGSLPTTFTKGLEFSNHLTENKIP